MTEKAFEQMMSGLKEAKKEYAHIVFPDCTAKYNAVRDAIELLEKQETTLEKDGHHIRCLSCGEYWCDSDREGNPFPTNFCPNCGKLVLKEQEAGTLCKKCTYPVKLSTSDANEILTMLKENELRLQVGSDDYFCADAERR